LEDVFGDVERNAMQPFDRYPEAKRTENLQYTQGI
jgi:hypothetical protein